MPRAKSVIYALKEKLKRHSVIYGTLRFINRIKTILYWFPYITYYRLRNFFRHDVIFSQCYLHFDGYKVIHNNWGDDINKYFFEYAAKIKMAVLPHGRLYFFHGFRHYSLIGSVLNSQRMKRCTIYGTGIMTESLARNMKDKPEKIISVRGPETRRVLLQHDINCPEHYGDPVLLLPLFYTPKLTNQGHVSIIPNMGTFWDFNPVTDELAKKHGCKMVNMTKYNNWTDIIDMIAGSSFVISESLHGLIVAETYNIPCVWAEFVKHIPPKFNDDWSFKFLDFYESIGKYDMQSIKLYEGYNFDELMSLKNKWQPGRIDYEKLLEYFPFEIKPEFKAQIAEFLKAHKNSPEI